VSRHRHEHEHERLGPDQRALAGALTLLVAFMGVEAVAGVLAGSLALLADAGHMLADAASVGLALFAVWLSRRPPTPKRSFGYRRAEILAALANGVALVAVAIWIFIEAGRRLADPPDVAGGWILAVGSAGLAINLVAAALLYRRREASLNVRAAFRHVLADLAGSFGVIAAAIVILTTGWDSADPLIGLAIGLLVLASSWRVLKESIEILLEATPTGVDAEAVGRSMIAVESVVEVHDLHIWTITSGFPALSAHVLVDPEADCHAVRRTLEAMLQERFGLEHTTLQVDHARPRADVPVEIGESFRRQTPLWRS